MRSTSIPRSLLKLLPLLIGFGLVVAILLPLSSIGAQKGEDPPGYTDYAGGAAGGEALSPESSPVRGPSALEASLVLYPNRAVFDSVWPGLPLEDFEASLVPPNSVLNCFGTLSSQTDDACFALGSIQPGLVISPTGDDYAVLTSGFLGLTSTVVGPNTFIDDTHIFLTNTVQAVGLDFLDPLGVITITIDIYGPENEYLGSDIVSNVGATPVFWGVSSNSTPIEHLFITADGGSAELLDNVAFGGTPYMTHDCNAPLNPVANCSFETGNFAGWLPTDLAAPFFPLQVNTALVRPWSTFFFSQPTHETYAALNGFDGGTPGLIQLAQDVSLPIGSTELLFDYRAAWDFSIGAPATLDRHFMVNIEPPGGGPPLLSQTILTATAGTIVPDTGNMTGAVDVSAFAGTDVRINFLWAVPEMSTGPGFFQLDNVLVEVLPPVIDVSPGSMSVTHKPDEVSVQSMTIDNPGHAPLDWSILEGAPVPFASTAGRYRSGLAGLPEDRIVLKPADAAPGSFDCAAYEDFVGAEPEGYAEACMGVKPAPNALPAGALSPMDTGYAQDIGFISDNFVTFTLSDFPSQTVVATSTLAMFGMDFDETASILYGINDTTGEFGTIDLGSAAFTPIGPLNGLPGTWTGLSVDPTDGTVYASNTDGITATLYTVNVATGATTQVGPVTGAPLLIDIAVGPNGQMYGHDISVDSIFRIDKKTGAATLVGPTGFPANFAQGMDFDNQDGTLYIFLYQGGGANVYGVVDLFTGAVTPLAVDNPLGEWEGATQTVSPCDPTDIPWVSVSPTSGTIAPGGDSMLDVTFDSTGMTIGNYTANLCVLSNDPVSPLVIVPMDMTVAVPNLNLPIIVRTWP